METFARRRLAPLAIATTCFAKSTALGALIISMFVGFQAQATGAATIVDVVYKTVPTRDLTLSIYRPANWQATDRRPAIIFFHGGGWSSGTPSQFAYQAQYYQQLGMVAILAAYRLRNTDGSYTEAAIYDARSALRWLKVNARSEGIDPIRIIAAGGSAGGHLAIGTALFKGLDDPSDDLTMDPTPLAIVAWNPVVNTSWPGGFGASSFSINSALGSPLHRITQNQPPIILMHGDADTTIAIEQARTFRDAYIEAGNKIVFHEYAGAAHGFFNSEPARTQTLEQVDAFLSTLGVIPVHGNGWIDTHNWLGWIHTGEHPYWWIERMRSWAYVPDDAMGWFYFHR
jgi:acetyl esterase/lipase